VTGSGGEIRVSIGPLPDLAELKTLWQSLEQRANGSVFVSWPWISTWLRMIQPKFVPALLIARLNGVAVAAGLVVRRHVWRRNLLPVHCWILHATGDDSIDGICIEYNGLLFDPAYRTTAWRAVVAHFLDRATGADEFRLDGVPQELVVAATAGGARVRETYRQKSRHLDLQTIRDAGGDFLPQIGSKTRANVRRTERAFQRQYGQVVVDRAASLAEALVFVEELKGLHERRWTSRNGGGAFSREFFAAFHTALISGHFDSGLIQLLRVRAGRSTIATLYNLIHDNTVYFYQSGINYELVKQGESPGMLAQVKAIEYNARLGHGRYDMLAGDTDYKRALTSGSTELWWGSLQKPLLRFRMERYAESSVRYLRRLGTK
jgi:CelD/BcsL family acetyltransferase involved in cellulose biosynthesis